MKIAIQPWIRFTASCNAMAELLVIPSGHFSFYSAIFYTWIDFSMDNIQKESSVSRLDFVWRVLCLNTKKKPIKIEM